MNVTLLRRLLEQYAHENRGGGVDDIEIDRFLEWIERHRHEAHDLLRSAPDDVPAQLFDIVESMQAVSYILRKPPQDPMLCAMANTVDAWARGVAYHEPHWRPMKDAPRDRSCVLLQMKRARDVPQRPDYMFEGVVFVGRWGGDLMLWSFAAPVGMGGIPDDWIAGWQPLPIPPCDHEWTTDPDGDHHCTKCPETRPA